MKKLVKSLFPRTLDLIVREETKQLTKEKEDLLNSLAAVTVELNAKNPKKLSAFEVSEEQTKAQKAEHKLTQAYNTGDRLFDALGNYLKNKRQQVKLDNSLKPLVFAYDKYKGIKNNR